ncbi:LysE family translocator [Pistricoccus aurantiacus]|uniref:LysE family translocator n=1 Tax=Pistricoccus aurantiacus TaxID=1883414 RepID=UPI00363A584B
MTPSLFLSMAAFALAASISPGPVNIVALSAGAQYGFRLSMRHVTGATCGFTLLLLLIGLGLHELLYRWPYFTTLIQGAGVAFLLFMAYRLATDDGRLGTGRGDPPGPSMIKGAIMQWLNPKAWLASLAGMGIYAASDEDSLIWQFTVIYFVICYLSITCWACAGTYLRRFLHDSRQMRRFNRLMAALLAFSAIYLVWL